MPPPLPGDTTACIELNDGVVFLRWSPGAVISESQARAAMNQITGLCTDREYPLLVEIPKVQWVHTKAMKIFSASWPLTRVAIIGPTPVDHVIVHFYLTRHTPPCPTQLFSSVNEALTWLRGAPRPGETRPTADVQG